jgi:hypothetical protein
MQQAYVRLCQTHGNTLALPDAASSNKFLAGVRSGAGADVAADRIREELWAQRRRDTVGSYGS